MQNMKVKQSVEYNRRISEGYEKVKEDCNFGRNFNTIKKSSA